MEKGRTFRRNKCILKYNSANFRQIIINKQKKTSIKNDYNVRLDIGIESNGVYLYSDKLVKEKLRLTILPELIYKTGCYEIYQISEDNMTDIWIFSENRLIISQLQFTNKCGFIDEINSSIFFIQNKQLTFDSPFRYLFNTNVIFTADKMLIFNLDQVQESHFKLNENKYFLSFINKNKLIYFAKKDKDYIFLFTVENGKQKEILEFNDGLFKTVIDKQDKHPSDSELRLIKEIQNDNLEDPDVIDLVAQINILGMERINYDMDINLFMNDN